MLKETLTTSGLLAVTLLGMAFVFIRLGIVAVALHVVLGAIHPLPVLQMASVAVCVAVIDRLQGLSQRTVGVFWLSVLGFVAWALAAMLWGDSAAAVMAAIWASTVTALLSYWLVRDVWPAVPPMAIMEACLCLRPGKWVGPQRKQR